MRIYEKSVSFVRPNPKFGAKLAITDKLFNEDLGYLMPSLSLTPWPRPDFMLLNYSDSYLGT
jgi:hypothetical protein